ncbi:RtcB family protein [Flavitalea sp.]|nr:RtcB family protein [Flavitalea sp.]
MKKTVTGKELIHIGYREGKILGLAKQLIATTLAGMEKTKILPLLKKALAYPELFLEDEALKPLAVALVEEKNIPVNESIALSQDPPGYQVYGGDFIEDGAKDQMAIAMRLPVTVAGALMPDAHQGYGLPIGGVLATKNAIIPYGVGVDIGCRMALSIFDIPEIHFLSNESKYKRELVSHTKFGAGAAFTGKNKADHEVLDSPVFKLIPFIRHLQDKAHTQLGTSGGGNHFVEWGIIEFSERDEKLDIEKGRYLALLSHSGSRGFGATIAGHYTKLAKQICQLPKEAANLAYLDLKSEEGNEYWLAMNLAGDYASACHETIHNRITKAIGGNLIVKIENHHNFAWKEVWNGEDVLVHRKGATPAGQGVMGIIPGSMTAPGFLVRGRGEEQSINSASHGAGRQMSRTKAIQNISRTEMNAILKDHQVTLIGAGLDEAPMAYKDINKVMAAQTQLVDVVAKFVPRIVRMANDGSRED